MTGIDKGSIYNKKISAFVLNFLRENGVQADAIPPFILNKKDLTSWLLDLGFLNADTVVDEALSFAFDQKYYNYYNLEKDTRELNPQWITDFKKIVAEMGLINSMPELNIIEVGCNNASQIKKLELLYKKLYLVDIGHRALEDAKKNFPDAITIQNSADNLSDVLADTIDLYLSFRTYNSSYFLIEKAIFEMSRVLKKGGQFVLSLPNGYLNKDGSIVEGMFPPKSNIVDKDYVYKLVDEIGAHAGKNGFSDIKVLKSFYEIFVYSPGIEKSAQKIKK